MSCAICGSSDQAILFNDTVESSEWYLNNVHYDYIACDQCGFIQCHPVPPADDLLQYYREQYAYDWFQKNTYFKKWQASHRLGKVRRYLKGSSRILDFGCGHGFFVQELAREKFESFGFDIGADKIMEAGNARITNKNNLEEYTERGFDVISLWHVLEHMRDHDKVLEDLAGRINPGGKIIIAVPNISSLGYKLFRQKWGWVQQPYVHINHYNRQTLSMLLQKHGFSVRSASTRDTWDQNLYDLLITYFFYRKKSRNPVRKFGNGTGANLFFRANQVARLLFTPVSYLVSFIRKKKEEGSELLIVAEKKRNGDL
ncbi:class I SAM-dependent methyltransferase [Sediminibacterium roseum]|uniref:Class I SAM-dependent methyltransferase n=1 Tax=Sediminibacterium roseum TaxID=1978412 RepID=A0ABW9ZRN7_9BACT|nr:class I SAM-dependent methyltransferase [Sediminibacterium roseum]NCI49117.1 class I SAM-dependent methyltransferase [Sediminibacterium roseum]